MESAERAAEGRSQAGRLVNLRRTFGCLLAALQAGVASSVKW